MRHNPTNQSDMDFVMSVSRTSGAGYCIVEEDTDVSCHKSLHSPNVISLIRPNEDKGLSKKLCIAKGGYNGPIMQCRA